MANEIGITWTSDQKQLIADMKARATWQEQEIVRLRKLNAEGRVAGTSMSNVYKDITKQIEKLGRTTESTFKNSTKLLNEQKAAALSLQSQKLDALQKTADAERSAAAKSLGEQKAAASALRLQRLTAFHDQQQDARAASAKLLAEQKAASSALRLQKLTALHEQQQSERSAAAKSLAEQKAAAQALQLQKLTAIQDNDQKANADKLRAIGQEREATRQFYAERKKFWQSEMADEKSKQDAARRFRGFKAMAIEEEKAANRTAADQVRKGLLTEQQVARQNFRERMRQIHDLRRSGALSQADYLAATKQAYAEMRKVGSVDLGAAWRSLPPIIASTLTLTAGLTAGIRLVKAEIENVRDVQRSAAGKTMTFAQAEEMAIQSLDPSLSAEDLNSMIMKGARDKNLSPTSLMRTANATLASRGEGVTSRQAVEASIELGEFTRLNPEQGGAFVSAVLAMKAANPNATYKELAGQLQQAKISSKVATLDAFSQRAVPGAVAARAYGDTEAEYFGIYSAIGGATNDTAGRTSASGSVDLQKDLQILSSGVESGILGGKAIKGGLGKNTKERLKAIAFDPRFRGIKDRLLGENEDPEMNELFKKAGRMSVESRNFGFIRLLYQGDDLAWKNLETKMGEQIEAGPVSSRLMDKQLEDMSSTPTQNTARTSAKLDAIAEGIELDNQAGARGFVARDSLDKLLKASGVSNTEQIMKGIQFEASTNFGEVAPAFQAQKILRDIGQRRARPFVEREGLNSYMPEALMKRMFEGMGLADRATRMPTADEKQQSEALMRAVAALEKLAADESRRAPPQVNVQVGAPGDKPADPPAAGLHHMMPRF